MAVVIDTAFLIDLQRTPERAEEIVRRLVAKDQDLVVPVQAAVEFAVGFAGPNAAFDVLVDGYRLMAFDEPVAREAARLGQMAAAEGIRVPWADLQIAATASWLGTFVVTRNLGRFREPLGVPVGDYQHDPIPLGT
ncbi:MAG: type II toxin-antitoxin system VapC family toxin [Thermoplasmatota archaeon]